VGGFLAWDAGVLLRRSEQSYSHLFAEHSKEGEVREVVICVRQNDNKSSAVLDDWLPVAELALVSEIDASVALPAVLHVLCRYAICLTDTTCKGLSIATYTEQGEGETSLLLSRHLIAAFRIILVHMTHSWKLYAERLQSVLQKEQCHCGTSLEIGALQSKIELFLAFKICLMLHVFDISDCTTL
jgi:hypothetical protein